MIPEGSRRTLYSPALPPPPAARPSRLEWAALALLVPYLMYARTRDSFDSFVLMRDQIRDWSYALGPLTGLPLTGTQSTAGGYALGPIYYWVLWLSRVLIGPWTSNLPPAGAIGISLLQTAADLFL